MPFTEDDLTDALLARINPNFRTPVDDYGDEEFVKLATDELWSRTLFREVHDTSTNGVSFESSTLLKSNGVYVQFNRDTNPRHIFNMYMLRVTIPGGGPITRDGWRILDDVASRYARDPWSEVPSLRLTTRQNIQYHWVSKRDLPKAVNAVADSSFFTLNGCGDNTRNVMGCPASHHSDVYDATRVADALGRYFRLPPSAYMQVFELDPNQVRRDAAEVNPYPQPRAHFEYDPNLLNRKFKIAFSAGAIDADSGRWVPDNCVELRTNDVGIAPIYSESDRAVSAFQIYVGGGQGQRNIMASGSALGQPVGIFTPERLFAALDAIVDIHMEWGDREERAYARVKYLIRKKGVPWYQDQLRARLGAFDDPNLNHDYGARHLHHGWSVQPDNGLLTYGAWIESGRLIDGPNGRLKTMTRHVMDTFDGVELFITPNQDLLFTNIQPADKALFSATLARFGYGLRNGREYSAIRHHSGSCVALPTCGLAYTDSERFLPDLLDELERMGWGDQKTAIGITGCERQCFRPATKEIGLVGVGNDVYMVKLGGTEDARHQGTPLAVDGKQAIYLRMLPKKRCAGFIDALFRNYVANRHDGEDLGYFHRRVGPEAIVTFLTQDPATADLMAKVSPLK